MAQQGESIPITIQYAHDDECVVMMYSQQITHNRMTEQQACDMVKALNETIYKLKQHKLKLAGVQ